jgi:hypothetical protein
VVLSAGPTITNALLSRYPAIFPIAKFLLIVIPIKMINHIDSLHQVGHAQNSPRLQPLHQYNAYKFCSRSQHVISALTKASNSTQTPRTLSLLLENGTFSDNQFGSRTSIIEMCLSGNVRWKSIQTNASRSYGPSRENHAWSSNVYIA